MITFFLKSKETNEETIHPSIEAEAKMAMFIMQDNTFFNLSDNMSQYTRQDFKGSKAAEKFACSQTKMSAIGNCIGNNFFQQLNTDMQKLPFNTMLNPKCETGLNKMFPITVRIFDMNFCRVMKKFYDINYMKGQDTSTAQAQFQGVDDILAKMVFNGTIVPHWDLITLTQTLATEIQLKQRL